MFVTHVVRFRRSGRLKSNGPVIEENTIDEAIDVEEYLSEDEYVSQDEGIENRIKKVNNQKEGKIAKKQKVDDTIDNFDEKTMEITLENASIEITMDSIADMIGIINKGVDILDIDIAKDEEMIKNWEDQF
ncbi:hypothetical protein Tco_0048198, partial [Tanacetum coccineum]